MHPLPQTPPSTSSVCEPFYDLYNIYCVLCPLSFSELSHIRVTPSSARAFGGVNVMFGQTVEIETEQNEASSSWPMSKTITVAVRLYAYYIIVKSFLGRA